jgi:hypothetical protein
MKTVSLQVLRKKVSSKILMRPIWYETEMHKDNKMDEIMKLKIKKKKKKKKKKKIVFFYFFLNI